MNSSMRELLGNARPFIIAEIGVNHNGRLESALELIAMAARCGAQAVKFQAFRAERLVRADAPLADYQARNMGVAGGQFEMLRALEIDIPSLACCAREARRCGLAFGVTPFDPQSLQEILALEPDFVKIGSGDADNYLLLEAARNSDRPVIVSTGMCDMEDVERLLAWFSGSEDRLALLHCVSAYPAPPEACNLAALPSMRRFGVPVGFSDHTRGHRAAALALTLGAEILERHITLDRTAPGPDHACSSDEADLRLWMDELTETRRLLGDGRKRTMPCEEDVRHAARKSVQMCRPLKAGQPLGREDVICLRPAGGLSPSRLPELLGRPARHDLETGRQLESGDLAGEGT